MLNNSKEIPTDSINNQEKKSPPQNKAKSLSSFTPLNDKGNPSVMSRQNSAFKNLKSETKSENINIFPNTTPKKSLNPEFFNSIISPFRDIPIMDATPFKHGNYNISSPENLRFNSPMNGIIISDSKNFIYKNNPDIQGKKIDFNPESIDMMKLSNRMPLTQNSNSNGFNNRIYNNINNNNGLFNQSNTNINNYNNNIDYSNQKPIQNINSNTYIDNNNNNQINNMNNISTMNMNMNNMISVNNLNNINNNKCTCSKTGCKKKYCACFSRGRYCDGCECKNCENFPQNHLNSHSPTNNFQKIEENEDNMESPKTQRVICNCTKSNCMKKYCECFKRGFACNSMCRCLDCKNKVYINDINNNNIINNEKVNYNMNTNNENSGYNNYMNNMNNINNNNNDSINTNNFYNYALHNNINNNIINNNIINNSYIPPETFGKSLDYSNPINFQPEAFGICIKKDELKLKPRKINLNDNVNMKEALINNFGEINETPKFSNKKRLRTKNDNSTGVKTCPTTNSNSANKLKKAMPLVNKYIKKKRLQLN